MQNWKDFWNNIEGYKAEINLNETAKVHMRDTISVEEYLRNYDENQKEENGNNINESNTSNDSIITNATFRELIEDGSNKSYNRNHNISKLK